MNIYKTAVAIAVGSLFAGAAFAQSNYEIEQRDRNQEARIEHGIQSGQITHREADRLRDERAHIERLERRARADGTLTQHERARIDGAQDRLGRHIYQESHDRQTSNRGGHRWDNRGDHRVDHRGNHNGWDNRGDNRGNHNGWDNRGDNRGNHNSWGRGTERGSEHAARGQGVDHRNVNGGQPDRGNGRQASMPQAQVRSTQAQPGRQVAAANQGNNGGRRTR